MTDILEKAGFGREFIFSSYAKYVNAEDSFYIFNTNDGDVAVSFKEKKVYNQYQLLKKLKLSVDISELNNESSANIEQTSLSDIYLNLFELEPLNDDILLTKEKHKAVFLFYDSNICGYAYLDEKGVTNFISDDFGFWSPEKEKINRDKPIYYTSDLINIVNNKENYILGRSNFLHINRIIEKIGYKNMLFDDKLNWFYGNLTHLNNNTPTNVRVYENKDCFILFSNKKLMSINSYIEHSQPFENRYILENMDFFDDIVSEINMPFNLPLNPKI